MRLTVVLSVLGILSLLVPILISRKDDKVQLVWFYILIVLDALCVKYIFPYLPATTSDVAFFQSLVVSAISAVFVGFFVLGLMRAGLTVLFCTSGHWVSKADAIAENVYFMFGPFINALILMFWTLFIPPLGFTTLWPGALFAGLVLHFLDIGIARRWMKFFKNY